MPSTPAPSNTAIDIWATVKKHLYYFEDKTNVLDTPALTLSLDDITDDTMRRNAYVAILEQFDIWEESPDPNHVLLKIPRTHQQVVMGFLKHHHIPNTTDNNLFKTPQEIIDAIKNAPKSIRQEREQTPPVTAPAPAMPSKPEKEQPAVVAPQMQEEEEDTTTRRHKKKKASSFAEDISTPPPTPGLPISLFMAKIAAATTVLDPAGPTDEILKSLLAVRRLAEQAAPHLTAPVKLSPQESTELSHHKRAEKRAELRHLAKEQEEIGFLEETRAEIESCSPNERPQLCQQMVQSLLERATIGSFTINTEKSPRGIYYINIRQAVETSSNPAKWKQRAEAITNILSMLLARPADNRPLSCHHNRIELKLPPEHPAQTVLEEFNTSPQRNLN